MMNPVAHEVRVVATGARPGESAEKRELFTEETSTVLVFENGAVIRLQAAVIQGQLLFLTNQESKREVVAQVTRMRAFRPTNSYVELEFTEPSPNFWGVEFPDAAEAPELVPVTPQQSEAAEFVNSAEIVSDDSAELPATPSVDAVEALKSEVEALREQLKLLQTQTVERPPVAMSLPTVSSLPETPSPSQPAESSAAVSKAAPAIWPTPTVEEETPPAGEEASFSEENLLPKPALDFNQGKEAAKRSSNPELKVGSGGSSSGLRIGLLAAALLLIALTGAWYEHWIPGLGQPNGLSASASPRPARPASPAPAVSSATPNAAASSANSAPKTDAEASAPAGSAAEKTSASDTPASEPPASETGAAEKPAEKPGIRERLAAVMSMGKHSPAHSNDNVTPAPIAASVAVSAEESTIVPPKLIKSVRPNPPAEALQGYISGNVNIDALIDTSGHVKSMNIISGAPTLRNAAVEALKQYRYEPATLKGKPVPAHVNVTVQFWYEP